MSLLHQLVSILGQVLILAVLQSILPGNFMRAARMRKLLVAALLGLSLLVPVGGLSVAQWLRSVFGDTSILTLVVLLNILAQRLFDFNLLHPDSRRYLLQGIAVSGVVFYPLALGLGSVDPYYFGYSPLWMSMFIAIASIVNWFRGQRDLAVALLVPLLAFNLQLLESTNLWDYLLDPIVLVYALVQSVPVSKIFRYRRIKKIA